MTNFEKLKSMSKPEFVAAIAATVSAFKTRTEKLLPDMPNVLWCISFADWLRGFMNSEYDGAFDEDERCDDIDDILKDILSKKSRHNPFEED